MDGFDHSTAPPEYNELKWLADIFVIGMAVGWVAHYVEMIYTSFKDQTYCMTIGGLCINFAWEIIFCTMYPAKGFVERVAFLMGISLDLGVIYAGIKNAPNEWRHSAMVRDHMPLVFAATTLCCLSGHLALTAQDVQVLWVNISHRLCPCSIYSLVGGFFLAELPACVMVRGHVLSV
ncbi:PaxB [Aspergillus luchuensis]|uniref:PaxB n=1 Tax=Aspergillus kawachii TaxID=1069201 RepID=A0A146F8A0_ASPKA|nr:PaxB [Aspergillus luchuensis]